MNRRAVALAALAAALLPAPSRAADQAVPVATVGAPIPGDVAPASLFRPATYRAAFRVPHADTALYIGTPWFVRDLTITVVGPGRHRETVVATTDLPGHMLGLRVPADAWIADRVELQASVVSAAPPFLLSAETIAAIGWRSWWYQALFGLFAALALVFGVLAVILRARVFAYYAATAAAQAGLLLPLLGIVRPAPELSELLDAALHALALAGLALFTLAYFGPRAFPRWARFGLWALVALNVLVIAGDRVLQDLWQLPDRVADALTGMLDLAFVTLAAAALSRGGLAARYYLAAAALAAFGWAIALFVPPASELAQSAVPLATAGQALLLALALTLSTHVRRSQPALAPQPADGARLLAPIDGLTGIPDRAAFDLALGRAWDRGRRTQSPLAALLLDIDHFKTYNELYGHHAGDDVLRRIAGALAQTVARRHDDLAARYGGEEFAVLLPATGLPHAQSLAEAIRTTVETLGIAHGAEPAKRLTVSIGVASLTPQHAGEGGELMRRAADAVFLAKTLGRNRVVTGEE